MDVYNNLDILMIDACDSTYLGVDYYLNKRLAVNLQHLDNFDKFHNYINSINKYDLFIIDIRTFTTNPDEINGFDLLYTIRKHNKKAKIIVYTLCEGVWYIKRMKELKVNAMVHKKDSLKDLYSAVVEVLQGNTYICRTFRTISTPNNCYNTDSHLLSCSLNPMETLIIRCAAKGMTSREIANTYNRSVNTIMDYRKKLFVKFNVNSMEELLSKALRNGFPLRPVKEIMDTTVQL